MSGGRGERFLLDTHVWVRWVNGAGTLSRAQRSLLGRTRREPFLLSDVSLLEVAGLVDLGRLKLQVPLRDWLESAIAPPRIELQRVTPAIAVEVASLPPYLHRDPADRALVATARVLDATLVTCDEDILSAGVCRVLG